ncbi:fumarate hydratase [bacterium]|nr:fumarate hydratase [bacterium]MBU1635391.1 fumarate hydratase [bacterium]MBU1873648.1 fumarate hydratase [bacterium]
MKEINVSRLIPVVRKLCIDANYYAGPDVVEKIKFFMDKEESPTARDILALMLENHKMAAEEQMPMCQDTGVAVVFVELGQDVHLVGGDFNTAINEGVRQGYQDGYLRKSMVDDPVIERKNTRDNTPALIYTEIVPGDSLKITVAPKGGGAENMSEVRMMKAADGIEGVKDFVVDRIKRSGGNPCPPVVVGVGIGGSFEQCALLAKKALLRPLTEKHPDPKWAAVEDEILERINKLGIGPQGLGGRTTALAVQILYKPCHIASMPVAVNVNCHAHRHESAVIE